MVEAIATAAAAIPELVAVWIFGSTARGAERPRDLDLALLFGAPVAWPAGERLALAVEEPFAATRRGRGNLPAFGEEHHTEGRASERMRALAVIVLLLVWSTDARAVSWFDDDHQALPCRPTIACTADIVPPGSVEIEVGYLFRKLREPILQHSLPILAKLTLSEWVQLQIGGNGPTFASATVPTRYLDDVVAGFKFHLADQSKYEPSLSWSVELSSPVSSAPGFIRTYDLLATVYVTKDFRWLHADLNVGLNLWQVDGPAKVQPWVALALSVELPRHFTIMAEGYYFDDASPIAPQDGGFLLAIAYAPRAWIVLDIGGDVGYFQSQRSLSLFLGMTIAPVDFWQTASERRKLPRQR